MWLFPSVASGSSLPANSRHIFSNDDGLWPAKEGVVNAMRESASTIVFISLSGFAIALFPSQGPSSLEENVLDSWRIFPRSVKMRHGGAGSHAIPALMQSPYRGRPVSSASVLFHEASGVPQWPGPHQAQVAAGWFLGGFLQIWRGEHDDAIKRFERAMRLSPLDPEMFRMHAGVAIVHL